MLGFADKVLRDAELTGWITSFVTGLAGDARVNSLGAKLIQLTMPGVADTYQGCELGAFSLVDPDNRRPVDFAAPRQLLAALDAATGARPGRGYSGRPRRGQAAGDLGRAAAAPRASRLVRRGLPPAGRRGPGGPARGVVPARPGRRRRAAPR